MFKGGASIPPQLCEEIRDENLKLARDRDLFNKDYFKFAAALVDGAINSCDLDEERAADAAKFAVRFCVNLAWHTRKDPSAVPPSPSPIAFVLSSNRV